MDTLGKRILSIRCDRSRDDFASEYGVHRHTLAKWEADTVKPSEDILSKIAIRNNVPLVWLLYGFAPIKNVDVSSSEVPDDEKNVRQSDVSENKNLKNHDIVGIKKNTPYDLSDILGAQQEINTLNRELRDLLRENGDLRVEIERKNARIAELERELVCALKSEETSPMASAG